MGLFKNFAHFPSREYIRGQYAIFTREEQCALEFLHRAYADFNKKNIQILELGGGPTIYQLISASTYASDIVFTDYLPANLAAVEAWVQETRGAKDWGERFRFVARLEGMSTAQQLKSRLQRTLRTLRTVDILADKSPFGKKTFDVVSSHFCAESITNDSRTFRKAMRFIAQHVKPNGMLVMSFLKNAKSYAAGKSSFVAYSLDETELRSTVKKLGFSSIEIQTIDTEEDGEQNANMFLVARKTKSRHISRK